MKKLLMTMSVAALAAISCAAPAPAHAWVPGEGLAGNMKISEWNKLPPDEAADALAAAWDEMCRYRYTKSALNDFLRFTIAATSGVTSGSKEDGYLKNVVGAWVFSQGFGARYGCSR